MDCGATVEGLTATRLTLGWLARTRTSQTSREWRRRRRGDAGLAGCQRRRQKVGREQRTRRETREEDPPPLASSHCRPLLPAGARWRRGCQRHTSNPYLLLCITMGGTGYNTNLPVRHRHDLQRVGGVPRLAIGESLVKRNRARLHDRSADGYSRHLRRQQRLRAQLGRQRQRQRAAPPAGRAAAA